MEPTATGKGFKVTSPLKWHDTRNNTKLTENTKKSSNKSIVKKASSGLKKSSPAKDYKKGYYNK